MYMHADMYIDIYMYISPESEMHIWDHLFMVAYIFMYV